MNTLKGKTNKGIVYQRIRISLWIDRLMDEGREGE